MAPVHRWPHPETRQPSKSQSQMWYRLHIKDRTLSVALGLCMIAQTLPSVTWVEQANHKWRPLDVSSGTKTGFTLLAPEQTGIQFSNQLDVEKSLGNQVYLNGSGVALGDVDGDGRCDIYLCGLDNSKRPPALTAWIARGKTLPEPCSPTWTRTATWI